jgi:hypothetical protein
MADMPKPKERKRFLPRFALAGAAAHEGDSDRH